MRLTDKTAIITGGGSGIGLACARLFVQEGARVALFGRRQDRLNRAVQELGESALAVVGDMTRKEDLQNLVDQTTQRWGRIDILVNNAGVFQGAPFHEMDESLWNTTFDVNLNGVFKLTQKVIPHMLAQKSGSLIHISSILGMVACPDTSAYNASKGALNQFSRSLAAEYGAHGIRSNAICPGLIETEMTEDLRKNEEWLEAIKKQYPVGRFGVPEDVAQACLFFADDASAFVTGAILPVDGGYTAL